jgi:hypothetical protein
MGPQMKVYLPLALLEAPPQELNMRRGAWEHYHHTIARQYNLDHRTSAWELPRLILIALLALNTWVMIGLLGMLFGPGFWPTVGWAMLASAVTLYFVIGIALYFDMMGSLSNG